MPDHGVTIWFNPRCSKCRSADQLLTSHGVPMDKIDYLDDPPSRKEIKRVLRLLGAEDPRAMMRTQERLYRDLDLDGADDATLIAAMAAHPELIERPIVIRGNRAVVARPAELALELLEP